MSYKQSEKDALIQADRAGLIHPQHHPIEYKNPQLWVSGNGIYLTNYEGNTYIDGLSSMWNVYLGHGRKELADAGYAQLKKLAYSTSYAGTTHIQAIQLVEKIKQHIYPNIEAFYFTQGGSDATDTSIRTARFYWLAKGFKNKLKIISSNTGYHGSTIGSASATGCDEFSKGFGPRLPYFVRIETYNPYRFKTVREDVSRGVAAADLLEDAILREGADTVAAFIIEPVQGGGGGIIVPDEDYFKKVRQICDKYNVLLISDEVINGFGRTGRWFALEHFGIKPDIVQFAKGITSGYFPLGGVGFSGDIKNILDNVSSANRWWHGYTCSAHPVGCAIANANIKILEDEGLVENAARQGKKLKERLLPLLNTKYVGDVRGLGLLVAVELVNDKETKKTFDPELGIGQKVKDLLYEKGLVTRMLGEIICLAPPLIINDEQTDKIADIVIETIEELQNNV
jgi:adenosylmethionine-8-amino-7-oxononanoate aminotransferase